MRVTMGENKPMSRTCVSLLSPCFVFYLPCFVLKLLSHVSSFSKAQGEEFAHVLQSPHAKDLQARPGRLVACLQASSTRKESG